MDTGIAAFNWARHKVAMLERYDARRGAYTEPNYQWNFRVAVSCPPSTVIHMRGGQVWGDPEIQSGTQWYIISASYDLADADVIGHSYVSTNAYYYIGMAVMLRWSGNPDTVIPGTDPPLSILRTAGQATAVEAENEAYPLWPSAGYLPNAGYGIPLGIFVLRNNGNTTLPNQFMPIDRVNRGRSYLWRDLKVRFQY